MAPTKSDICDVLLSISCNKPAISTDAVILTRAARAASASRLAKSDSKTSGLILRYMQGTQTAHDYARAYDLLTKDIAAGDEVVRPMLERCQQEMVNSGVAEAKK